MGFFFIVDQTGFIAGPSSSHGPNFSREAAFLRASKIKAPDRPPEERGMSQTPLKT
jgi:hypothetical protein